MTLAYVATIRVTIDGRKLGGDAEPLLEEVVVEDHLHRPAMFTLRFGDPDGTVIAKAGLAVGCKVVIAMETAADGTLTSLVTGEVTALEGEFGRLGNHVVVRGYDGCHRLHRQRTTTAYTNEKDSDIATKVAREAGVQVGTVDQTSAVHARMARFNLTGWEFLRARAREIGYEVHVRNGRLDFRRASSTAAGSPVRLTLGDELLTFRPRLSSAELSAEVRVRSWDPATKKAVIGAAPGASGSASLSTTPSRLASSFGRPVHTVTDRQVATQAEADAVAQAMAERITSAFAEAEGTAFGDPRLHAGAVVEIAGVPATFRGRYTLTATRHGWDALEGYMTSFEISGRQERSLLGLASLGVTSGPGSGAGHPVYGTVVGLVTNVNDPKGLGRVKLKFPWLSDTYESDWARMLQLGAGKGHGAVFLPEVDDEVLVAFEQGDTRCPYVLGALYNGVDKPVLGDKLVGGSGVARRGIVSKKGHKLVFLDDDAKSGVALMTAKNLRIALKDSATTIHISSGGKVVIEGGGDVSISAKGSLTLDATGAVSIQGQSLSLKGKTAADLDAGAGVASVKGTLVKIN